MGMWEVCRGTEVCDPHLGYKTGCCLNEQTGQGPVKVLDSWALTSPFCSKGLKISELLYFSLVLISEQTKDLGVLRDLFRHQHD